MIDTIAMLTYLLGDKSGLTGRMRLHAVFNASQPVCTQPTESPQLQWSQVPPAASSLALTIKDATPSKKNHYEWVVYNLPVELKGLPFGSNHLINRNNEGVNTWGVKDYHQPCWATAHHPVVITLYALDKRFSARKPMTGERLEEKMKGHVLSQSTVISRQ